MLLVTYYNFYDYTCKKASKHETLLLCMQANIHSEISLGRNLELEAQHYLKDLVSILPQDPCNCKILQVLPLHPEAANSSSTLILYGFGFFASFFFFEYTSQFNLLKKA